MRVRMRPGWQVTVLDAAAPKVKHVAELVAAEARRLAPYDTGRLHDSIEPRKLGRGWLVVAVPFYAHYQEFGTRRNRPHPFLRPAAYTWYGEFR